VVDAEAAAFSDDAERFIIDGDHILLNPQVTLKYEAFRSNRAGLFSLGQERGCRRRVICTPTSLAEVTMNWDRVAGNWKQFSGKVKEKWGDLTDDDLTQINGNREQLEGKIQARYGYAKDRVKQEVDDWCDKL
jgi:uncharacterized protein YjbJ (UPF0337 family)